MKLPEGVCILLSGEKQGAVSIQTSVGLSASFLKVADDPADLDMRIAATVHDLAGQARMFLFEYEKWQAARVPQKGGRA